MKNCVNCVKDTKQIDCPNWKKKLFEIIKQCMSSNLKTKTNKGFAFVPETEAKCTVWSSETTVRKRRINEGTE